MFSGSPFSDPPSGDSEVPGVDVDAEEVREEDLRPAGGHAPGSPTKTSLGGSPRGPTPDGSARLLTAELQGSGGLSRDSILDQGSGCTAMP